MRCSFKLCRLRVILVCLWSIARTTNGGSITWYEPLPVETIVDVNVYHTNSTQFLEGASNSTLSWKFSLTPDLSFNTLNLKLNDVPIAGAASSGPHGVLDGFKERFDISWFPTQRVTLVIFSVTANEKGTYACEVSTTEGFVAKVWKSKLQVNVVVPPNIDHISGNQTVHETDSVTLFCNASGDPTPTITWTRLSDNSNVTFPLNISRQDQGGYRCTADNGVGSSAIKETFISVQYPPSITHISPNQSVNARDTVSLNCSADGFPAASITWRNVTGNNDVNVPLPIGGIHDQGYYRCIADNGIGNPTSRDVFITVQSKLKSQCHPTCFARLYFCFETAFGVCRTFRKLHLAALAFERADMYSASF